MINKTAGTVPENAHNVYRSQKINMVTRSLFVAAMAGGVALAVALPAAAAGSPTATTFTVTGGSLSIAAPASAALTNAATGSPVIKGYLGTHTVTDARGGTAGWIVSGISTAFTGPGTATTTSSTAVQYNLQAGDPTWVSTGTVTTAATAGAPTLAATTSTTLITATAVSGNNTASWNPNLYVSMPSSALAGSYSGTVTVSVA